MPERQSSWLLLPQKMRKDKLLPGQPKGVYRVKNWAECLAGRSERGNVSLPIDEQALASRVYGARPARVPAGLR